MQVDNQIIPYNSPTLLDVAYCQFKKDGYPQIHTTFPTAFFQLLHVLRLTIAPRDRWAVCDAADPPPRPRVGSLWCQRVRCPSQGGPKVDGAIGMYAPGGGWEH